MMLSIRYRLFSPPADLDARIENLLLPLAELTRLDEVEVMVEHRHERSPDYLAKVCVAVPGPDVTVEVADHNPGRACERAVGEIGRRLRARRENRERQRITGRKHARNFRMGRRSR